MRNQTRRFLRTFGRDVALVALSVAVIAANAALAYLLGWGALALLTDGGTEWDERMLVGVIVYCVLFHVVRMLVGWLDDRWWRAVEDEQRTLERP